MTVELLPIVESSVAEDYPIVSDFQLLMYNKMMDMYRSKTYVEPWIGYFGAIDNILVGSCGFKNFPSDGKTEIAYVTFEEYREKGIASEMCRLLVELADRTDRSILLTAQTLTTNSASHRILVKNGFSHVRNFIDDHEYEIMEWELH
jgi:[ribosomal protein S5]-alanine N-acetyltransferase